MVGRAQSTAASVGDGPETWRPVSDHDAHVASELALDADAVAGDVGTPLVEERREDVESCRRSMGQPRSSKSTFTWALIGVEVASVDM